MSAVDPAEPLADASPAIPPAPGQIDLMGLPLDLYTASTLIDRLISDSQHHRGGYVLTPNLDHLRSVTRSARLMALARDAEVRVADGMPLVWASRLQRTPLPERITGSDLIFSLSRAVAAADRSVFLLGGNPGTAEATAALLGQRAAGLRIAGTYCPPLGYERDAAEMDRIRAALISSRPDFVFVGLPFVKATELVRDVRQALPGTWFLGVGIAFSFSCGELRRAPVWMRRAGLEWLFRLLQEPRRLGRRYLFEGLPFAIRLLWISSGKRRVRPISELAVPVSSPPEA